MRHVPIDFQPFFFSFHIYIFLLRIVRSCVETLFIAALNYSNHTPNLDGERIMDVIITLTSLKRRNEKIWKWKREREKRWEDNLRGGPSVDQIYELKTRFFFFVSPSAIEREKHSTRFQLRSIFKLFPIVVVVVVAVPRCIIIMCTDRDSGFHWNIRIYIPSASRILGFFVFSQLFFVSISRGITILTQWYTEKDVEKRKATAFRFSFSLSLSLDCRSAQDTIYCTLQRMVQST